MNVLHYATRNKGKVLSMQRVLDPFGLHVVQAEMEIPEPQSNDLRVIAASKIAFAYEQLKKPVIVQDSAFFVPSLGDFPGTFVNHALCTIGIEGILKLVENKSRDGVFQQCLCYYDGGYLANEPMFFESSVSGRLAHEPMGQMQECFWSKLALIFIPEGYVKTQAAMSPEEYQAMRAKTSNRYADKFARWLNEKGF